MKIVKQIHFWIRYIRLVVKIRNQLPNYAPSGQMLHWNIQPGYYKDVSYDSMTGKEIRKRFVPKPRISQRNPKSMIVDDRVYEFDWNAKELKIASAVWR